MRLTASSNWLSFWIVVGSVSIAFAQSGTRTPTSLEDGLDEIPPELQLPVDPSAADVSDAAREGLDGSQLPFEAEFAQEGFSLPAQDWPAPLESSGTWLRRGFWYAEQDVVVLNRDFFDRTLLAFDTSFVGISDRRLGVENNTPDAAVAGRFTLGRFLFRDGKNNDHMLEYTYFGLGEWFTRGSVTAFDGGDSLHTLFDPFIGVFGGNANRFVPGTGSLTQAFTLETEFHSFELNYRLRHRPNPDQIELGPDGQWTRKLWPTTMHSYLFGLRLFQMDEGFQWIALGVDRELRNGDLRIRTSNDMVGLHFGGDIIHQRNRWSIGVRGKIGPFINFSSMNRVLEIEDTIPPFAVSQDQRADEDTFSFVADLGVFVHYHLRPNVTLRTGFEALWVNSVATAIEQISFETGALPTVRTAGAQYYKGMSFGVDFYW